MKTVRNTKLFRELQSKTEWETLFNVVNVPEDGPIGSSSTDVVLKDDSIPILYGGLDHIEETPKGIYFIDTGVSSGGKVFDNSFVVREELNYDFRIGENLEKPGCLPDSLPEAFRIAKAAGYPNLRKKMISQLSACDWYTGYTICHNAFSFTIHAELNR